MISHEDLFGHTIIADGNVSSRCEVKLEKGTKFILLDGGIHFCYEENDKVNMRMAWSEVYCSGFVTFKEAAKGANVTVTTVKNWVKRFKSGGHHALQDKIGRGKTRKLTDNNIKLIIELRERRKTLNEIARIIKCSDTAVLNVLQAEEIRKRESEPSAQLN